MAPTTSYRRIPAPQDCVVEHAWVTWLADGADPVHEVLLPDGRGSVVVSGGVPGRRTDARTRRTTLDADGVRGPSTRVVVRTQTGPSWRVGAQLSPLALSRIAPGRTWVDTRVDLRELLAAERADEVTAAVEEAVTRGDDEAAGRLLTAAVTSAETEPADTDRADALAAMVQEVDATDGLVRGTDLARVAGLAVGTAYRWFTEDVGIDPAEYLASVRFSRFVRGSLGSGLVTPERVLAVIRDYAAAGYPPREVERFTGLRNVDLQRVERGIAQALAPTN